MLYKRNVTNYANNLISSYINNLLTENDLNLLHIMFRDNPTQDELDKFLQSYDIEVAGGYKALMLTYFQRMHPELQFTSYEDKRLKGLFNFHRFQNMRLMSYFLKIGKVFNQNDIPMLILKGFAMKYLRPELSRAMGDIDILVPENCFIRAIKLSKKLGYRLDIYVHSIDLHEPSSDAGIMDIHRYIDMNNRKERPLNKYLFKRAKAAKINGIDVLVPCEEDLLFLSLVNLAKNLKCKTSKPSTLFVLFDVKYLMSKPDFDWDIVLKNMKLTQTQENVAFAVRFINDIIPGLIPKDLSEGAKTKSFISNYCINVIFSEKYFKALQKIARRTKLKNVKNKDISVFEYLSLKFLYKFSKLIRDKKSVFFKECILLQRDRMKLQRKLCKLKN